MNMNTYYKPEELVLISLGITNHFTTEQIQELLDMPNPSYAWHFIHKLEGQKLIKHYHSKSLHQNVYSLTSKGHERLVEISYTLNSQSHHGNQISPVSSQCLSGRISDSALPHFLAGKNLFYYLMKHLGVNAFKWQAKQGSADSTFITKGKVVPDEVFSINERTYLVETDMCTEGRLCLEEKFINYAEYFQNLRLEKTKMPVLMVLVHCQDYEGRINNKIVEKAIGRYREVNSEILQLEEQINLYDLIFDEKHKKFKDKEQIIQDITTIKNFSSITNNGLNKEKRRHLLELASFLDDFLKINEPEIAIKKIDSLKSEIEKKKEEKERLFKEFKSKEYSKKILARCNLLSDIILNLGIEQLSKRLSLYSLTEEMKEGLDIYVAPLEAFKKHFRLNHFFSQNAMQTLMECIYNQFFIDFTSSNPGWIMKYSFSRSFGFSGQEYYRMRLFTYLAKDNMKSMLYFVETVCCGCISGIYRAKSIIENSNHAQLSIDINYILVVDNIVQAKIFSELMRAKRFNLLFVDIDMLLDVASSGNTKNPIFYTMESGKKVFVNRASSLLIK